MTGSSDPRVDAVNRAVRTMQNSLDRSLPLAHLARAGMFSPFHFHRMFREVTSQTPGRFFAALRMAEAKRLLVRSNLTVTLISSAVGYESLGTFTTRFTQLVGISPGQFRRLARAVDHAPIHRLLPSREPPPGDGPALVVNDPGDGMGLGFAGVFALGLPHGQPTACGLLSAGRESRLTSRPPASQRRTLVLMVHPDATVGEALLDAVPGSCRIGAVTLPPDTGRASASSPACPIEVGPLRPPTLIDPPVLAAAPLLQLAAAQAESIARPR